MIDDFLKYELITFKQKTEIIKAESRRERVRRFLSLIMAEFDSSTYHQLTASLLEHNGYILHRLRGNEREWRCESMVSYNYNVLYETFPHK